MREPVIDPNLLRTVARSVQKTVSTAPAPGQVDLVIALGELSRAIVEHNRRFLAGEPVDWAVLADQLGHASKGCRRQAASCSG